MLVSCSLYADAVALSDNQDLSQESENAFPKQNSQIPFHQDLATQLLETLYPLVLIAYCVKRGK